MSVRYSLVAAFLVLATSLFSTAWIYSSQADDAMEHQPQAPSGDVALGDQINSLRRQVVELETRVRAQGVDVAAMKSNGDKYRSTLSMGARGNPPPQLPVTPAAGPAMNPASGDMMAGMMNMMSSMMGGMSGGGAMGAPVGMGSSVALSTLPGFPGASHLYHVGSTNFFLDHPEHITLSLEQQSRLGQIRMQSALKGSEFNRRIQEGEEQLWLLTAADQPSLAQIEPKIREIEKLRGDQRLALIKDVGEAAIVLTNEQRRVLLGQNPPMEAQSSQGVDAGATLPGQQGGGMGDM